MLRPSRRARAAASAFLAEAASSLSPLLERAHLLDRSAERERTLVAGSERRLMRLGFDLHDGPIQDVLAAAADLRRLRDDVVSLPRRASTATRRDRRFDDLSNRLVELDQELRELAHSLESRSAVSRPIEEVLHREVETFTQRSGIARATSSSRATTRSSPPRSASTLFRAVQESLSNVREHAEASTRRHPAPLPPRLDRASRSSTTARASPSSRASRRPRSAAGSA